MSRIPHSRALRSRVLCPLGAALLLLGGVAGCSSAPEGPVVTLSGHVVDGEGQPVAGIDVGYYKKGVFASDSAAVSESDGSWEFEVPEPFMAPPAGKVFFQHKGKKWAMAMHRADQLPEPVVLELAPEPRPEPREGGDPEGEAPEAPEGDSKSTPAEEEEG